MALISIPFDRFMLHVVRSLGPYRQEVVLVGGCANALYRHHRHASAITGQPLATLDLDLATPSKLPTRDLTLRLSLANAGLLPLPENQRTNKYKTVSTANETLELLCPTIGISKAIRDQSPSLVEIQLGSTAEALDYMDILFAFPWTLDLRDAPPLGVTEDLQVRIPNPVSYIMQKVLIRRQRKTPAKRAKDSYYIYEIAVLFRNALPALAAEAGNLPGCMPSPWCRTYLKDVETLFGHMRAEGIQEAKAIADENHGAVTQDMIHRAMAPMLEAIRSGLTASRG
jgi:hypothetical protein